MSVMLESQGDPIQISRLTTLPPKYVKEKIDFFLDEDAGTEDVTTLGTIPNSVRMGAHIVAEEECIAAGTSFLKYCFPSEIKVEVKKQDGSRVEKNEILATGVGPAQTLLSRERVILNLLQRLCGIASTTQKYVNIAEKHGCKILDTRKMTPGLRLFEKYAVAVGGGFNHRLDLRSAVLIKDNHLLAAGGIHNAIRNLAESKPAVPVELEVDTLSQLTEGLNYGINGFLLDNMSPSEIKKSIQYVKAHSNGQRIFMEASGGITLDKLEEYASTGIEAISIGALTTGTKNISLKMEFKAISE